jgi:DNA-binding GntR family transcriptional regulator
MSDTPLTITDQVLAHLRSKILNGEIPPGARIDQGDVARIFGVSLVPVREALARLQSSGLVHIVPHRGVFVETVSLEELIDIYYMREVLEEQAAQLAVKHVDEQMLHALDAHIQQIDKHISTHATDLFLQATRLFHFTIYHASQRRNLIRIIAQLWDQSDRYRRLQMDLLPERFHESQFENRAMLAACRRHDGDSLALMVRYRIHQTTAGLREQLQKAGKISEL